ncbi:MAG: NAD(P)-dependent glycerol-3-phosphate dehydrogenase [Kosmotoga sp.]|nr:MAG: NAD(P)-dependent glycerol-3-phosphate dehydrogenase [Kosmotoga sp.]
MIAVIGAGSWGSAISKVISDSGNNVLLWVRRKKIRSLLEKTRRSNYIEGLHFSNRIQFSSNLGKVINRCEIIFNAVPVQYIEKVYEKTNLLNKTIVNLSKGIEISTLKRPSQIFMEKNASKYAVLSGPSYAEEVSKCIPTSVVVASNDIGTARMVRDIFNVDYFRVYSSSDVVGTELAGAQKNVFAIAAGIIDGMGGWFNTKAALITRSVAEMTKLGMRFNADEMTFMGLAGVGDLVVTCTGKYSRNRYVGQKLAEGYEIKDILNNMKCVAEGVPTSQAIHSISLKEDIELPISSEVYRVLYENKSPEQGLNHLMKREQKDEHYFRSS